MTREVYEKIIENLKNYKIRKFCPYLENEPLLDEGLFDKIEYAIARLDFEWVEISTNLAMLNDTKLAGIKETLAAIPHEIWVSFHGASKESYENIMGLNFEKSLNNVLRLVELAQDVPLNIVIRGAGVPQTSSAGLKNWFAEGDYLEFWRKNLAGFKRKPRISFFAYHNRAGSVTMDDKEANVCPAVRKDLSGFYCVRFDRWLHFLYSGEPILCCMDYKRETAFGASVKDKSIEELFSSASFKGLIRKGIGEVDSEENFICKRCISPGG